MDKNLRLSALTLLTSVVAASCGGGGSSSSAVAAPPPGPGSTLDQQITAARTTATTNPNCAQAVLGDFYWEIGDASGALVSGTVPSSGSSVGASTVMPIASASKWLYSAYVLQRRGVLAADVPFLNFTSGYSKYAGGTGPGICFQTDTVQQCLDRNDSAQDPATVGKFVYDSGHMEVHAGGTMGLGAEGNDGLATAILQAVDFGQGAASVSTYSYTQPLLAGGVATNASYYALFLRRILSGALVMKGALGTNKICTNPATCSTAVASPITQESWNYSLGHWVEDDPQFGDHAFSSAGAFGFYPWIDSTKTYYGIVARNAGATQDFEGYKSAQCGRLIRQAWMTGVAVTSTTPTP